MRIATLLLATLLAACGSRDPSDEAEVTEEDLVLPDRNRDPDRTVSELGRLMGDDSPPPWTPREGQTTRLEGTVVSVEGNALADVLVQLIYPGDPHYPVALAYETRTSSEGAFAFSNISRWSHFPVVLRRGDDVRSFQPRWDSERTAQTPVRIRLGPSRPVRVHVRCGATPTPPERGYPPEAPALVGVWLPESDVVTRAYLIPTDPTPDSGGSQLASELIPGTDEHLPRVHEDARDFEREISLPVGRHRIVITGSCGWSNAEIEVPAEPAEVPTLELIVPAADFSNVELVRRATTGHSTLHPSLNLGGVRLNRYQELRAGVPLRWTRLQPGAYEIGGATCHHPIAVPPRANVMVTIGSGRCDVESAPR